MASSPDTTAQSQAPDSASPKNQSEMKIDPSRALELASNLTRTLSSIKSITASTPSRSQRSVRLVAVSKLKPASDILALASPPSSITQEHKIEAHLHFGENYTQELHSKAAELPRSIRWHFIGALQSNKCKALAEGIPNLWAVESLDSVKKADALERGRKALRESDEGKDAEALRVYVQVNTSGEESKSGVSPGEEAVGLARHVVDECPNLVLQGLMTIGAIARSQAAGEGERNEDFATLKSVRSEVAKELGLEEEKLELSMGMSADYEDAIRQGSDAVRIGTGIFGERPPRTGKVEKEEKHDEEGKKEGQA